ncbi:hypothetical protein [Nocardia arthritidis]|uniref:hypothetical protein n=1 Tax=Nocardia arthritidis TaxID=228602 RepID=UPI00142D784F|nr:hypothetical protein [Nocardia arthritidis]
MPAGAPRPADTAAELAFAEALRDLRWLLLVAMPIASGAAQSELLAFSEVRYGAWLSVRSIGSVEQLNLDQLHI